MAADKSIWKDSHYISMMNEEELFYHKWEKQEDQLPDSILEIETEIETDDEDDIPPQWQLLPPAVNTLWNFFAFAVVQ